jgi:branched-chain amino acid transport system substrate-binding protein
MKPKSVLLLSLMGTIFFMGTVSIGFTAEREPIKIGIFGPLTGRFADMGTMALKGAQFAIKEANAEGGIDGRQIKLFAYDDRGDRKEAVSVVRKMIEQDKVCSIIGGSISLTSIAAAPVVNSMKIPMIASFSNALNVVKGHPYVFRWCSVADVQGYIMAHHAVKSKGYKTFALLIQDEEYGRGIGNGMQVGLEKLGGKIVYKAMYSPGEKEFRPNLTAIKELNPDAVFVSGFAGSNVSIAIQGHDLGVFPKAQLYGG